MQKRTETKGCVNALFSGLAFAGLIITIRQQHKDLENQREAISTLSLKPVGTYIACWQLKKLSGEDISIDIFYKQ